MKKLIFALLVLLMTVVPSFVSAADVTLAWDANTESNLAGYKLYYSVLGPGEPYGTVVDVGNVLEYTFEDLDLIANSYWFVATAYNTSNLESGYSNEVTTKPTEAPTGVKVWVTVEIVVN